MDIDIAADAARLRDEFRAFLSAELPADIATKVRNGQKVYKPENIAWQRKLAAKGWLAPNWSKEWGGTGWGPLERFIWDEESAIACAPRANVPGIDLLGPVIIEFGTEEQKKKYLPRMLSSEDFWCQGFSEPQAGSDLAALQMRAVRGTDAEGDHYRVNGTKLWTSYAHDANMIFCLVRTSIEPKKQAGISFLLIDMEQPGITVSPIITLGGAHVVNEVRIEDVRVPAENLLGREGQAWEMTRFLLGHERLVGAGIGPAMKLAQQLRAVLRGPGPDGRPLREDARLLERVSLIETDLLALRYTAYRVLADELSGKAPGPEVSVLKIRGGEIQQGLTELLMETGGIEALAHPLTLPQGEEAIAADKAWLGQQFLERRKLTIYGGSSEIQRNIIAQRILRV